MVEIQIINNQDIFNLSEETLREWKNVCINIADYLNIKNKVISIAFTNDDVIKSLNLQYRNKDYATDVLSFPLSEVDSSEKMLGELIISVPMADRQAKEYGNTMTEEVSFLLLHGILHLVGYDHNEDHRGIMRNKEKEIIEKLGFKK